MNKQTITFRLDTRKKKAIEVIAQGLDRDRSYVLNEAVTNYLETHQWQVEHIKEGIKQADAGRFASPAEVTAAFGKWRKSK